MTLGVPGLMSQQEEGKNGDPLENIKGFRNSARELLHKLDLLEKRQVRQRFTELPYHQDVTQQLIMSFLITFLGRQR